MTWMEDLVSVAKGQLGEHAREVLWARGVTDEQIDRYSIGYLDRELPSLDYTGKFIEWSRDGAKLDDVFVFPLTNTLGDIRGLQFRHVDRERKGYMDFIPNKSEAVLFGLSQAMSYVWDTGRVHLVEGSFDLFPIQRVSSGTIATLTAHVAESLWYVLRRFCYEIWLVYDMDSAGRKSSAEFVRDHSKDFDIHVVSYPRIPRIGGGFTKDPGELWEELGESKFVECMRPILVGEFDHA